jgi:tetratricopeptide (TPR) repeat protein
MAEVNFTLKPGGGGGEVSAEERKKAEAKNAALKTAFTEGVTLSNAGKNDEAIAKFNEVIAMVPKCPECYTNIGANYAQKKDWAQAEASYKKAIEVDPNSSDAYNGLANVYNAQKKFDQAAEASAQAMKLSSAASTTAGGAPGGNASALFNQGVILWNAGKIADAKKQFEEATKIDPKLADAHYWLGMANLNEGKMPDAATQFDEYLKLAPTGQYAEQAKGILTQIKK